MYLLTLSPNLYIASKLILVIVIIITLSDTTENLPIFFILFHNLPMGEFVFNTSNVTVTKCNGEEMSVRQTTHAATDVIGAQVGKTSGSTSNMNTLLLTPVVLNFSFKTVVNGSTYRCVYWNFSDP